MIALLAGFFIKRGLQSRFAAPLAYLSAALAVTALIALSWGGVKLLIHHHDKGVVQSYEANKQAEIRNEVSAATNAADTQANITAARDEELHNQVQEDIKNAVTAHPVEAHRSAGPASSAALDRLRHRPH